MVAGWRIFFLLLFWVAWWLAFVVKGWKQRGQTAVQKDNRARWGILLQGFGFALAYTHRPPAWAAPLAWWRLLAAVAFALPGIGLAWTGVTHLGRQWRVDAGLNADHELVQGGPYRFVRHPIYASMLCMLLTSVALAGTMPGAPFAIVLFLIGIEIRVRIEDALLTARFGERFHAWQKSVPAYIPLVR